MHKAVCLRDCIKHLVLKFDGKYVDATFGRGGHSAGILEKLEARGRLFAFDCDPDAAIVAYSMESIDASFKFYKANFTDIPQEMEKEGFSGKIDGILMDLGVSSPQLDVPTRGFSFLSDGPLDMRMDPSQGRPVSHFVNTASELEIRSVIREFGEERFASKISRAIVINRQIKAIETTQDLVSLIKEALPNYEPNKHPATRTFQALRIYTNRELEQLESLLDNIIKILAPSARIVILSYHSLEHKLVKKFFQKFGPGNQDPYSLKMATKKVFLKKIISCMPDISEIQENPRSRSARLTVYEKII